jgi:hypothetical protein
MLANGGGGAVNPAGSAFTYRPGNSSVFIVGASISLLGWILSIFVPQRRL